MSKSVILAAAAVAVVGAAGAFWYTSGSSGSMTPISIAADAQETTTSSAVSKVPDMILGNVDAKVTVVEYASYTCPHCANFHDTVWDEFKKNYIDSGKVKFVYREVYFDKFGLWAAMIARCGGPEKYFGINDMLYDGQRDWLASTKEQDIADALRKVGLKAGMTSEALDACLNDKDMAQAMVAAYQTNATNDKVQGTPTFIVNGESFSGEMTYDEFSKILDKKLADG